MTSYTPLSDSQLDPNEPITSPKMKALRDNPLAIAEGDPTAPRHGQGFITGYVRIVADALDSFLVTPSIDGIGSAATVAYDSAQNTAAINLNVDWSSAAKGDVTVQTTYTLNTVVTAFAPEFLMNRNVIGTTGVSAVFTTCFDTNGNPRDTFEYEFLITYDRSIDLPI